MITWSIVFSYLLFALEAGMFIAMRTGHFNPLWLFINETRRTLLEKKKVQFQVKLFAKVWLNLMFMEPDYKTSQRIK